MTRNKRKPHAEINFAEACEKIASALRGNTRAEILDAVLSEGTATDALAALRTAMRAHAFPTSAEPYSLRRLVDKFDSRSRREGLHVLEGWDYRAKKFPDDIVPILLLDYCAGLGIPEGSERAALAMLLDQYFQSILMLLAVRAWDDGDANSNIDRVTALLRDLQGPPGRGLRVVDDAETLLLLSIAYYNPEEKSFAVLMSRVRTLGEQHRLCVALPFAGVLGSHLRWGLRFMYRRDIGAMRDDNIVDYPMLLFTVVTLLRAYARICDNGVSGTERDDVVEGLLNGLASDPWAFTATMPGFLAQCQAEYDECRELLGRHRTELLVDIEKHLPSTKAYSPLGFGCNFLSNAAVAIVAIALGNETAPQQASLNALFTREREGVVPEQSAMLLADRLMQFSSAIPERLGAGGVPLIVYDPYDAIHWFNEVRRTL